jgi:hypothetical protein
MEHSIEFAATNNLAAVESGQPASVSGIITCTDLLQSFENIQYSLEKNSSDTNAGSV